MPRAREWKAHLRLPARAAINAPMSATSRHVACLLLLGSMFAATVAKALSLAPPQFGTPCVVGNYLVFRSSDSKRLICITADTGKELWSRNTQSDFWNDPVLAGGKVWVSEGTQVWECDPTRGKLRPVVKMTVDFLRLEGADTNAVWVAVQGKVSGHFLAEVDALGGRERWRVAEGHHLVAATHELAFVGTQQRRPNQLGYPFEYEVTGATLEAVSRRTGQRVWTYRPEWSDDIRNWWKNFNLVISGDKLVVLANGRSLDCLRLSDGKSLVSIDVNKRADGGDLQMIDGKVIGCFVISPFDGARRKFAELLLPDLFRKEFPSPPIDGTLMGITDGVGICMGRFDGNRSSWMGYDVRTGEKLWQKTGGGETWRWEGSHAGFIYISNREYSTSISTILRVNLRTGEWKELRREKASW